MSLNNIRLEGVINCKGTMLAISIKDDDGLVTAILRYPFNWKEAIIGNDKSKFKALTITQSVLTFTSVSDLFQVIEARGNDFIERIKEMEESL